ncbi:MAG: MotA/TolQ/ExbB proton channel family protein [Kiritimatiellia bacterium]
MNILFASSPLPLASLSSLTVSFRQSDAIGQSIIFVLIAMSIAAWSIMISKWMELKKTLVLARQFQEAYGRQDQPFALFAAKKRFMASPLFTIYLAAAKEASFIASEAGHTLESPGGGSLQPTLRFSGSQMDIIRRAADRACSDQALMLEEKMPLLAISITAAPFLGLLGTVWGVLDAFVNMASSFGGALLSAVAPGISGALLTTVVGLFVALPSSIGYNLIVTDIKRMCVTMDCFSDELMADLQSTYARREV